MENPFKNADLPVENAIKHLDESRKDTNKRLAKSKLELIRKSDNTVVLRNKENKEVKQEFEIEILQDPEDKRLDAAYNFLADTFGANEMDTEDVFKDQMRGLRYGQPIETGGKAVVFSISKKNEVKDEKGEIRIEKEVVGALDGGVISLQDEQGNFTGESVFMVYYVASKTSEDSGKNYRQYGLGRELMISAYKYAKEEAKTRGMQIIGATGECTYTSRSFWERMGWKRVYTQDKDEKSKKYKEISYVQPPLSYNLETGEPEEGSGEAPEHFMINIFHKWQEHGTQIGKKIASVVKGFYKTNNYISPKAFGLTFNKNNKKIEPINPNTSPEILQKEIKAYKQHLSAVDPLLDNFSKQMNDKKVRLLTKDEIKSEDLTVEDYITGDDEAEMLESEKTAA